MLTPEEVEKILRKIFLGIYNPLSLPKKLYKKVAEKLTSGLYIGFGKSLPDLAYDTPDFDMLIHMRENVFLFSAAKTFNYVLATEGLIIEGDKVLPYQEFKKRAKEVYNQYNDSWLQAEYQTAVGSGQVARAWNEFAPDAILKYSTSRDSHVSEVCRSMEGVTRPKNDPIWTTNSPLQHYRCRCQLITSVLYESKPLPQGIVAPPKEFAFNPGIKKQAYDKSHPYFTDIPSKYKTFAKENFGLPLPKPPKK
jgi:SPP1 gp7 family putative phage head morphogenesis protein